MSAASGGSSNASAASSAIPRSWHTAAAASPSRCCTAYASTRSMCGPTTPARQATRSMSSSTSTGSKPHSDGGRAMPHDEGHEHHHHDHDHDHPHVHGGADHHPHRPDVDDTLTYCRQLEIAV